MQNIVADPLVFGYSRVPHKRSKVVGTSTGLPRSTERALQSVRAQLRVGQGIRIEAQGSRLSVEIVTSEAFRLLSGENSAKYFGNHLSEPAMILRDVATQLHTLPNMRVALLFRGSPTTLTAHYFRDSKALDKYLNPLTTEEIDYSKPLITKANEASLAEQVAEVVAENKMKRNTLVRRMGDQMVSVSRAGQVIEVISDTPGRRVSDRAKN